LYFSDCSKIDFLHRGEVLFPRNGTEEKVRELLDNLEMYYGIGDKRNMYERRHINARFTDSDQGEVQTFTYFTVFEGAEEQWGAIAVESRDGTPACWRSFVGAHKVAHAGSDWASKPFA